MDFIKIEDLRKKAEAGQFPAHDFNGIARALNDMGALFKQIQRTNIYMSWGVCAYKFGYYCNRYPAIMLQVMGANHTGATVWGLDEGADLYFCANIDNKGNEQDRRDTVYLDMVLNTLDELIERPADWTDEEYKKRAYDDSKAKGVNMDLLKTIFGD